MRLKMRENAAPPKVQTWADVRSGLQKLIDTLPADAREQLEGDGDFDNDASNVGQAADDGAGGPVGDEDEEKESAATEAMRKVVEAARLIDVVLYERQYSQEERVAMAKNGQAMPIKDDKGNIVSGAYPIADAEDLDAAKRAFGRANAGERAEVKTHINKRAKALGQPEMGESKESEAGAGCSMTGDAFRALAPSAQKAHLQSAHGADENDWRMDVPAMRHSMHQDATQESAREEIHGEFMPLLERAISADGTFDVKIIRPGWGSSGYYSPDVLKRDGPTAFPKGTKMFWDHPLPTEESQRPERSLRDLAAEIVTAPRYVENHPRGPGLYATAKAFGGYKESINELAPHIGVSIRAMGRGTMGEAEGQKGKLIEEISKGQSVDFVTVPGAGGEIMNLFEAARKATESPFHNQSTGESQLKESSDVDEKQLKEAQAAVAKRDEEIRELRAKLVERDARDHVAAELAKVEGLPKPAIARLTEALAAKAPVDDDGELDKQAYAKVIREAVKAEMDYLQEVTGRTGRVLGMGTSTDDEFFSESGSPKTTAEVQTSLEESFKMLGLSENIAKQAALGRG